MVFCADESSFVSEQGYNRFTKVNTSDDSLLTICHARTGDMITGNDDDENILVVGFEYRSNSNDTRKWKDSWEIKAFQNGIQLKEDYRINYEIEQEIDERYALIASGATLSFCMTFQLRDFNCPITIDARANYVFISDNTMRVEYDLSKIQEYYRVNPVKEEDDIQDFELTDNASKGIQNKDDALNYLKRYLKELGEYIPQYMEFDGIIEQGYNFHGYDDMGDRTVTSFWYAVSPEGRIYDGIACEHVDEVEYDDSVEYILPYSDSRYYTYDEISQLSSKGLRIARNEIFARYGYIFNDEELNNHFSQCWWYVPIELSSKEIESCLNDFEKENIQLIKSLKN